MRTKMKEMLAAIGMTILYWIVVEIDSFYASTWWKNRHMRKGRR